MKSLNEEFKMFLAATYPNGTVPEQFRQIKDAFYGGGAVVGSCINTLLNNPKDRSALWTLRDIAKELEDHLAEAKRNAGF